MKRCTQCGVIKPLAEFYKSANGKDGRMATCKQCKREYAKRYREVNREEIAAYQRAYRQGHREELAAYNRSYREANREELLAKKRQYYRQNRDRINGRNCAYRQEHLARFKEYQAEWQRADFRANPEKYKAAAHRRRARMRANGGHFTTGQWRRLCQSFDDTCLRCGEHGHLTIDHVVPLSRGGHNGIDNIQPLCLSCNSTKGTDTTDYRIGWLIEYRYSHF